MNQPETTDPVKCKRCGNPADPVVYQNIIYRDYDQVRRKQVVKNERMPFCSEEHANHHQMSCEG